MQKKDNLITKFRTFFFNLDERERIHLWDILTALRGNDEHLKLEAHEKCLTTARIRGELFGEESFEYGIGGHSYLSYSSVPDYAKKKARTIKKNFNILIYSHFQTHVRSAIKALNHYCPKKSMRDLQKFIGN